MSEFFAMGGYALYVWGSVAGFAAVIAWNALSPLLARAALLKRLTENEVDEVSGDSE